MVYVTPFIHRHIGQMERNKICTTRDFLKYGSRTAVDTALWRCVKNSMLIRVARGVFIRGDSVVPAVEKIVEAKAAAFGKKVIPHCSNIAAALKFPNTKKQPLLYQVDKRNAAFDTIYGRVIATELGARKQKLANSKVGDALRALWHQRKLSARAVTVFVGAVDRKDRGQIGNLIRWLPAWLSQIFIRRLA